MVDEKTLEAVARELEPQAWAALNAGDTLAYRNRRVSSLRKARNAITAYLQALSPGSTGETEGWVLVPKEPTSAQLDRAVAFALNVSLGGDYRWTDYMRDLYGRFLSAAGERG